MRISWNRACLPLIVSTVISLAVVAGAFPPGIGIPVIAAGSQAPGDSLSTAVVPHEATPTPGAIPASGRDWSKPARAGVADNLKGENVWRGKLLNMLAVGMAVGDVTGDGKNDIVLIDPNTVYLYSFVDKGMSLLAQYSRSALEFKSVDAARIRKMGPARIYVTAQNRGALTSFVLEFRGGKLIPVIESVPYYLRIIDYPTQGLLLLGQRKGLYKIYDGPIYRMEDTGDSLKTIGRFGTPLKIPIFGFAIGDLDGSRKPVIAVYDRDDHLRLYKPSGKRMFLSRDYYGGSDVIIRQTGPESRGGSATYEGETDRAYYRPRMMAYDFDRSGVYDILAIAHVSKTGRYFSRMRMLSEGQVVALSWNGDTLVKNWSTPPIQGMVTDFAIALLPGFNKKRLIVVERKKTDWLSFLRSQSQVRSYDLNYLMKREARTETAPLD